MYGTVGPFEEEAEEVGYAELEPDDISQLKEKREIVGHKHTSTTIVND